MVLPDLDRIVVATGTVYWSRLRLGCSTDDQFIMALLGSWAILGAPVLLHGRCRPEVFEENKRNMESKPLGIQWLLIGKEKVQSAESDINLYG